MAALVREVLGTLMLSSPFPLSHSPIHTANTAHDTRHTAGVPRGPELHTVGGGLRVIDPAPRHLIEIFKDENDSHSEAVTTHFSPQAYRKVPNPTDSTRRNWSWT